MSESIYLDNGALARPSDQSIAEMQLFAKRHWPSVTAPYLEGKEPFTSINRVINGIRTFVGARERDLFHFTPSGAIAIAEVYHSFYADHSAVNGKNHVVTTPIEGASIQLMGERCEKLGIYQKMAPLNKNGQLTREALEKVCTPKTGLVSLSWAHPLTGIIHPVWEIGEFCRENNILLHVDISAVWGKLYFKLQDLPIDYVTFEGTLLHGPKGSGGLLVREGVTFERFVPEGMEGADLNLPALIGLGVALEEVESHLDHLCMETARLRNHFEEEILRAIPEAKILFQQGERLPHTTAIFFPGVMGELLAFHLREEKVFVSFGGGREQKLHHTLVQLGLPLIESRCALSFSLSHQTTEQEVERAIAIVVDSAQKCRTFSQESAS